MIKSLSFVCVGWTIVAAVAGCYRSNEPAGANVAGDAGTGAVGPKTGQATLVLHVRDMCDRLDVF